MNENDLRISNPHWSYQPTGPDGPRRRVLDSVNCESPSVGKSWPATRANGLLEEVADGYLVYWPDKKDCRMFDVDHIDALVNEELKRPMDLDE